MRSPRRLVVAALAGAVLVSGCALRDPRDGYAYGRTDGLWDSDYDLLLEWNFPTTANQGPLLAPQRFKPGRPAIGVPWATGNPLVPRDADLAPSAEPAAPDMTATDDADDIALPVGESTPATGAVPVARMAAAGDARARDGVDKGR